MKAITVRQPYAWAIIHGGKDIENRTIRWAHRGPLAIHAAARMDQNGRTDPDVLRAWNRRWYPYPLDVPSIVLGAIIGVIDLVDAHDGYIGCCQPWGFSGFAPSGYGWVHLRLANPRPLAAPVPYKGRLGLWDVPDELVADLAVAADGAQ